MLCLIAAALVFLPASLCREIGERAITLWNSGNETICQTQVWDIAPDTDDEDRVFCASNDGLCIYSGQGWEYLQPEGNPITRALRYDKGSGRLYSAGVNGFGFWLPDGYGSYSYTPIYINKEFRSFSLDFWRIALHRQKVLFQSQNRIVIFDSGSGQCDTLYPTESFRYLYEAEGRVWCQDGETLYRFTPDYELEGFLRVPGRIINLLPHSKGILAAVEREGLLLLHENGGPVPLNETTNRLLGEAKITCCKSNPGGGFLVGTTKSGLFVLDENGTVINNYPLSGDSILSLATDREGNIWTGFNNGAALIDNSSADRYLFDDRLGQVHCFCGYGEEGLLIGSNKGVFARLHSGDILPIEQFSGPAWGFCTVGTDIYVLHDQGIFRLDGNFHAAPVCEAHGIFALCPLSGDLYVAGTYTGLDLFCRDPKGRLEFKGSIDGYRGFTRNITTDEFDNIWVTVAGDGFVCLGLDDTALHVARKKDFNLPGASEQVFSTVIDGQVVLVAGSAAYRPEGKEELERATEFDRMIKLCGPGTRSISQDGDRFWYVGSSGAGFVERSGSSLTLSTGLLDKAAVSRSGSSFAFIGGNAFLGFRNGIGICSAAVGKRAPLHILSATAVGLHETKRFFLQDELFEVPADMNTIRISLAGLSADNRLEYRISSVSAEWLSAKVDGALQINALQSGRHQIEMRRPGESETCRLTVVVKRPWFLSLPMLVLYLLLIAGSILAAIQIVQHNNKKKQRQLQKEVEFLLMKNDLLEKERKLATRALVGVQADDELERYFNEIYNGFTDRLKRQYPMLSKTDLKICIFVKMHLSGKEIANRMNISPKGVEIAKYRLRKKLQLPPEESLSSFISGFDRFFVSSHTKNAGLEV